MKALVFWLFLTLAIFTGTGQFSEASSISSDNPVPETTRLYQFPCPPFDGENCWIEVFSDGTWNTGP